MKENPPRDKSVPGPAAYHANSNFIERTPAAFSIRPNTGYDSMFNDPNKKYPGPGQYDGAIEKNGFCMFSRYKNQGRAVISRSGNRFDLREMRNSMEIPGPGSYEGQKSFSSVKRNYGGIIFGRDKKLSDLAAPKKCKHCSPKVF